MSMMITLDFHLAGKTFWSSDLQNFKTGNFQVHVQKNTAFYLPDDLSRNSRNPNPNPNITLTPHSFRSVSCLKVYLRVVDITL